MEAAAALAQARVDIEGAPRLRPWLALWDAASEVVGRVIDAVAAFLEAQVSGPPNRCPEVGTPRPRDARRSG